MMENSQETRQKTQMDAQKETKTCPRCSGSMARESFLDLRDDTGAFCFDGWRCMVCGEIIDPLILANRKVKDPRPIESKTRKRLAFR